MRNVLNRQLPELKLPDLSLSFARNVANGLLKVSGVLGVELFGSIAREGHGNDLCFLLVTDIETYHKFEQRFTSFSDQLHGKGYRYSSEAIRRIAISSMWNTHTPEWAEIQAFYESDVHTDICVFPYHWRKLWRFRSHSRAYGQDFLAMLYREARPMATRRPS